MQKKNDNFLEKIVKKDYNNELEAILEKKYFNEDVKSILLNILYKIETGIQRLQKSKTRYRNKRWVYWKNYRHNKKWMWRNKTSKAIFRRKQNNRK